MGHRVTGTGAARFIRCAAMLAVFGGVTAATAAAHQPQRDVSAPQCRPAGSLVAVPVLTEASGLALSQRVAGRLWAHNDSGQPVLVALDSKGTVTGRLQLTGASVEDWEAVAVGPCTEGSCIYVGDIGDNDAERRRITVYRVPEPEGAPGSATVSAVFHATYPDGAHDAETLLVAPDGRLHIVTKGNTGPVALYRFPSQLRSGETVPLERVGGPGDSGGPRRNDRITDGAVSPDGEWVALRSSTAVTIYRTAEWLAGSWREAGRVPLEGLREPQGEGIAFGQDAIFLVGEGGGQSRPGTFARLTCTPQRE